MRTVKNLTNRGGYVKLLFFSSVPYCVDKNSDYFHCCANFLQVQIYEAPSQVCILKVFFLQSIESHFITDINWVGGKKKKLLMMGC